MVALVDDASLAHDHPGDGIWSGVVAIAPTGGTLKIKGRSSSGELDLALPVAVPASWRAS
jgi:hypothetical protein